ncbi:phosphatase PAP2 family protein [Sphingopyxis flava]|uniref:Undecaprenyl-diphosphatase n=1 Tax=Sphingopyxis flava TaxID=1507287 RepID=A0A1T5AAG8_9SPHN|nr:phosphatase PAP2 family protein [Sphingopyxis flava]SKB32002.1 undecaprenyl-diphosphatase [Sphingopyxis flava]
MGRWLVPTLLLGAALLLGSLVQGPALTAADVALATPLLLRADAAPPVLIAFTQGISWLGGGIPRWTLALLLVAFLWRKAGRGPALLLAATAVAANLASSLLKIIFDRPRPNLVPHLDHVASWSYPSGHATSVTAIALLLALLAPRPWRRVAAWCAAAAISSTALSRVMLGVHWPSDVLGGTMLGAAFAFAAAGIDRRVRR